MDMPPDFDRLSLGPENWAADTELGAGTITPLLVSVAVCLALLVLALLFSTTPLLDSSGVPVGP